jgi:hypothetical protein
MTDEYEALEDKFPLRPARGAAIALVIGTFIWIVIGALGLNLFKPTMLSIAGLRSILVGAAICTVTALLLLLGILRPAFAFWFRIWLWLLGKGPRVADEPWEEKNTSPVDQPVEGNWAASPADAGTGRR